MKALWFFLVFPLLFLSSLAFTQEVPVSEEDMISLINSAYGKTPLYEGKDIPDKHLHTYDFNDDGVSEWVVVPDNACGSTKNCTFFILQFNQKSKKPGWQLLLMADGKITPTTPWGFATAPRKTKSYLDIVSVFDEGAETNGKRLLARHIYTWDGKKYAEYTQGTYPPEAAPEDMKEFLQSLDKLSQPNASKRQKK